MDKANGWCRLRNVDRGTETATSLASFYKTQRPIGYRPFDEPLRETASRWNQPIGKQEVALARPWKVYSPRAIGITFYGVLSEFVEHTSTPVMHSTRRHWIRPPQLRLLGESHRSQRYDG